MPIYAYRCESCGFGKDVLQKMSDAPLTNCPECGKDTFRKQVTAAGFQLKGSGWYVTDFRGGNSANSAPASNANGNGAAGEASAPANGESTSSETSATSKSSESASSSTSSAAAAAPAAAPAATSSSGNA
jgi:putative FmdB family regulatory protein